MDEETMRKHKGRYRMAKDLKELEERGRNSSPSKEI
jgi:hypothetical protein